MKFTIITLFPGLINSYLNESIMKRAISQNHIEVEVVDLRQHTNYSHNQVDDYQFGGGKGMVLMVEPLVNAIESVRTKESLVVLTTPQGISWNQGVAREWANKYEHIILICGHYEGYDERIMDYIDIEVSIGDFVITGGELASLILIDSMSRVLPGVIAQESHENDSFENNLLDYPAYTKPVDFRGKKVPEVLLSGHHANIQKFRDEQQVLNTFKKRPDLLLGAKLNSDQSKYLEEIKNTKGEK